jgi:mono/diheme cytochrome c family protein
VVFIALCACAPALPQPAASDATTAQQRWPEATLADLQDGRALYVQRCSGCHTLKSPSSVLADAWPSKIAKMEREHDVRLAASEARLIERYLYAVSLRDTAQR